MYSLVVSAEELEIIRAAAPLVAERAKARVVKAPAGAAPVKRYVRKTSPIPQRILDEERAWNDLVKAMLADADAAERAAIVLANVVALHRGLPKVTAL